MWESFGKILHFFGGFSKGDAVVAGIGGGLLFGVRRLWKGWKGRNEVREKVWRIGAERRLWKLEEKVGVLGTLEGRFQSLSGRVGGLMSEVHDIKLEGARVRVLLERLIKERNQHTEELRLVLEDLNGRVKENRRKGRGDEGKLVEWEEGEGGH